MQEGVAPEAGLPSEDLEIAIVGRLHGSPVYPGSSSMISPSANHPGEHAATSHIFFPALTMASRSLLAIVPFLLPACGSASGPIKELAWTEQVEISPGEHVSIERHVRFTVSRTWGEKTAGFDQILESRITALKGDSDAPSFNAIHMLPLLLTRDPVNMDIVLVVSSDDCLVWARNGKPEPAYWAFRFHAGKWYRSELPQFVFGRTSNLLTELRATDEGKLGEQEVASRKMTAGETRDRLAVIVRDGAIRHCGRIDASRSKGDFDSLERR
jgi:hypothetical protein